MAKTASIQNMALQGPGTLIVYLDVTGGGSLNFYPVEVPGAITAITTAGQHSFLIPGDSYTYNLDVVGSVEYDIAFSDKVL